MKQEQNRIEIAGVPLTSATEFDEKRLQAWVAALPDNFYPRFKENLILTFNNNNLFEKDEDKVYGFEYIAGTNGMAKALKKTCEELDTRWFYGLWRELDWRESDTLEDMILEEYREE